MAAGAPGDALRADLTAVNFAAEGGRAQLNNISFAGTHRSLSKAEAAVRREGRGARRPPDERKAGCGARRP